MSKINIITEYEGKTYSAHRNLEHCENVKDSIDSLIDSIKISVYTLLEFPTVILSNGNEIKTPKRLR